MEQEATMARGTLALANLTGSDVNVHMPENPTILGTIVKVLHHAARGIRLASITWLPPSVLFGLRNMTGEERVCQMLIDNGLAFVLAGDSWPIPQSNLEATSMITAPPYDLDCPENTWSKIT